MNATADGAALLRGIINHPDDDDRRLVYADWLEENGEDARAEFVRCQLAAAATGRIDCERKKPAGPGGGYNRPVRCGRCDFCRPMRRAHEIHDAPESLHLFGWGEASFPFAHACGHHWHDEDPANDHVTLYLWRGFVEAVRCPLAAWQEHGPAVAACHPVVRVELTDKEPTYVEREPGFDGWTWFVGDAIHEGGSRQHVPNWLWRFMQKTWHATDGLAIDAASDALIAWARDEARQDSARKA